MKIELDADYGVVPFEVKTADGAVVTVPLDLIEAQDAYRALYEQHKADEDALLSAWADWLEGKKLPRLRPLAALQAIKAINAALAELKKKDPPPLCSPPPG